MNIIEANVATPDARVAITIARFNNFINDSLLEGAIDALKRIGQVKDENITVDCAGYGYSWWHCPL